MKKMIVSLLLLALCDFYAIAQKTSGNPILKGWYADPEAVIFNKTY